MYLTKQTVIANQPIRLNTLKIKTPNIKALVINIIIGIFSLLASIVLIKILFWAAAAF